MVVPSLIWRWLCPPSPGTVVISWSSGGWETSHLKLKLDITTARQGRVLWLSWRELSEDGRPHRLSFEDGCASITFEDEVDLTSQRRWVDKNYLKMVVPWWPPSFGIWRWSTPPPLIWRWLCPPSLDTTTHLWIIATVTIIILIIIIIIIIIITCSYHQYHHNLMILIILRDAIMAQNGSLFTQCVKGGISTKNNQIDQQQKWSPHKTIISPLSLLFLAAQRLSQDRSERFLNIEHLIIARMNAS